ncbi:MAG TPA: hypothetical protein VGM59_11140 [Dongiaceae bacterium]
MRGIAVIVMTLMAFATSAAADSATPEALAMIPKAQRLDKDVLLGKSLHIAIVVDKHLAREPKLPPQEPTYQKYYADAGVYMAYPLDVKLRAADPDYFVLRCDSGGSDDPQCVFSASQDPDQPGTAIPGTTFVIPGDGCVYSAESTDHMFNAHALYCLQGAELKPVKQPFLYAGFRSRAITALTLYADKDQSGVVAKIAPGSFVEVVLQDGDFFLLRNAFGLTGWAKLDTSQQQATEIEGFYYHGD